MDPGGAITGETERFWKTGVGTFFRLADPPRDMSEFTIRGQYQTRDGWRQFERSQEAENDNVARERVYADLGSRHGLKRTQIEIEEVTGQ